MKHLIYSIIIVLCSSACLSAQNLLFIGSKSYPSTKQITLNPKTGLGKYLNVVIAKKGASGIIALKTDSFMKSAIKGTAYIYLDNGVVIKLIDRGIYDFENNESTTIYNLTSEEVIQIRESNINTIRFAIKCGDCDYSTDEGNHSVVNTGDPMYGRPDFKVILTELFVN